MRSLVLLVLVTLFSGCIESENSLPDQYLVTDLDIIGEWYATGKDGVRVDGGIRKASKKGYYELNGVGLEKPMLFRVYKLDNMFFIAINYPDATSKTVLLAKFSMSRTQLVIDMLSDEWLEANPRALPGFVPTPPKGLIESAKLRSTSKQLEHFLRLHGDNPDVFKKKDVDRILFNRIETSLRK